MSTRLPDADREYSQEHMNKLIRDLEIELNNLKNPAGLGYNTSNFTKTTDLDASSANTTDIANVLATLIEDLKLKGILGK